MMDLFIRLENGNIVGHPYTAENVRQGFGVDPETNPMFARFYREIQNITPNVLQKAVSSYGRVNDGWGDVWESVDLTGDELTEKQAKINEEITAFIQRRTEIATELMNEATDPADKIVYQNHITYIQSYTVTDFNVPYITYPKLPIKDENGQWNI